MATFGGAAPEAQALELSWDTPRSIWQPSSPLPSSRQFDEDKGHDETVFTSAPPMAMEIEHNAKDCVKDDGEHKQIPKRGIFRWQFWVFAVLPVLLAISVSVEVFYLAQQREMAQARDDFVFSAKIVHTNLNMTMQKTIESAKLLLGTLLANSVAELPTSEVFENMCFSNPFFNSDKTIAKVIYLESVSNASREAWVLPVVTLPDMQTSWGPQPRISAPLNLNYLPVRFVSPPQADFMGLDFSTDPVNGPYLRLAKGVGLATVTHTFALRGGIPGQSDDILFKNGAVYHMPIFRSLTPATGTFTSVQTDEMKGVLLFVFWLTGVLELTMKSLMLRHTDVFIFDITSADSPTYVAHYESPENSTRPFYTPQREG